jgi:hypothetical protein
MFPNRSDATMLVTVGDLSVQYTTAGTHKYFNAKPFLQCRANESGKATGVWQQFKKTNGAKEVIAMLQNARVVPYVSKCGQGTFVHQTLAIELAGYCSSALRLQFRECLQRQFEYVTNQSTSSSSSSSPSSSAADDDDDSTCVITPSVTRLLYNEHWKRKAQELELEREQARKRAKKAEQRLAVVAAERISEREEMEKLGQQVAELQQQTQNKESRLEHSKVLLSLAVNRQNILKGQIKERDDEIAQAQQQIQVLKTYVVEQVPSLQAQLNSKDELNKALKQEMSFVGDMVKTYNQGRTQYFKMAVENQQYQRKLAEYAEHSALSTDVNVNWVDPVAARDVEIALLKQALAEKDSTISQLQNSKSSSSSVSGPTEEATGGDDDNDIDKEPPQQRLVSAEQQQLRLQIELEKVKLERDRTMFEFITKMRS